MVRIGLIGGMSWESSAEYYRLLNVLTREREGGLASAECLLLSVNFAEIEQLQVSGRWEDAGRLLAEAARSLEAGGAELVLLCTNTMHKVADAVEAALTVPLLHLVDATAAAVRRAGLTTVGLLGTAFTMEQDFYRGRLESHGLRVLLPNEEDRSLVHRVIYDELCVGVVRPESRTAYLEVVERLREAGAEGVILGCTEIELLIGPADVALPVFATTRLHVEAALEAARNPATPGPLADLCRTNAVKPFLLLGTRDEDAAADNEFEAFLGFTGLDESSLRRLRLERRPLGTVDLDDWSGIFLGGGPFNASDGPMAKSAVQVRVEEELRSLLDAVIERDFPFLGACYGIGVIGTHQGGSVDRTYSEPISRVPITLTPEGRTDPLLADLSDTFEAFVGHKEAIRDLPPNAVHLARSPDCPVQAFKVGRNVYATQFHPELDIHGLCTRIEVYKHSGYFNPPEAESLKAMAREGRVFEPPKILKSFVQRYARVDSPGR